MLKNKLNYKNVFGFLTSVAFATLLANATPETCFLSLPFFIALLYMKVHPVSAVAIFLLSFLIRFNFSIILSGIIACVIAVAFFVLVRKKYKRIGGKVAIASTLCALPFAFLVKGNLTEILVQCAFSVILTPVFISAIRVLYVKRLKFKSDEGERVCLLTLFVFLGLGFITLFGFNAYRSVVIFLILFCIEAFGASTACVLAITLAIAPSIKSLTLNYFAVYSIIFISGAIIMKKSRFLAGFFALACDFCCCYFLKVYGAFHYVDVLYSALPVLVYLFIPQSLMTSIRKQARSLNDRLLTKYAVNRLRTSVSGKLYDVSGMFYEMKKCLTELKSSTPSPEDVYMKIACEVKKNVCEACPNFLKCQSVYMPDLKELAGIISVGVSKNRVTLIDLTKNLTSACGYVNSIIFEMNSLISKYRDREIKNAELTRGKELILMQAGGVSTVLKNIALEYSKTLSYNDGIEKAVASALLINGIQFVEIMAFSSEEGLEINLVINEDVDLQKLIKVVATATCENMNVVSKTHLSFTHTALTLRPAPLLDAAFGIACINKEGSPKSGDTHSLVKINDGKFLIALSDGMGSGNLAYQTSKTAIALIESLYKAGLCGDLVINMVNKVLSLGGEDSFSAVDVAAVDLFALTADFIKVGSPHSYVLTSDAIKIIEGNSLPLGILDELKPTGVSVALEEGATIMLISDGVQDAFGSSTDFISYLKGLRTRNPQSLADEVCSRALTLVNGSAKDDMTVVCVRIFKKVA